MRRLAKASRGDVYQSKKDYQVIVKRQAWRIRFPERDPSVLAFLLNLPGLKTAEFCGFGAYVFMQTAAEANLRMIASGEVIGERKVPLSRGWNRLGIAARNPEERAKVVLQLSRPIREIFVWGMAGGALSLPDLVKRKSPALRDLNSPYICPETLYLDHSTAIGLELVPEVSTRLEIDRDGIDIETKKCSYCQRFLPLNSRKLGSLAFHKHLAKRTKHQNECRACKKWRINDAFNPERTVDQLHESSVITRERSLLLREPEILQRIKDRHGGAGLKSIVWNKFGRGCFWCGRRLSLSEVQIDHTRPLAYLWPIDEHATCLCEQHNNLKKDKFPSEIYNDEQLRRLSAVTGLSLKALRAKDVNDRELRRIVRNITYFARNWSPRTFNATARKIREIRPNVDLFAILKRADSKLHKEVTAALQTRPA